MNELQLFVFFSTSIRIPLAILRVNIHSIILYELSSKGMKCQQNISLIKILMCVQVLAKGLSPAWLRVGGTESDYGTFVKSSQIRSFQEAACPQNLHCSSPSSTTFDNNAAFPNSNPVKFNLTQKDWDSVNEFAIKVDWKVLFGLNVQFRTSTGVWNSTNAADMIRYTIQRGYQTAWALGNGMY